MTPPHPHPDRVVTPELVGDTGGNHPLSGAQMQQWRSQGYVLVDGLLPPDLVDEVAAYGRERFAAPDSAESEEVRDFGSPCVFPSSNPAFDAVTLHPRILGAVAQLLDRGVDGLRLTQSNLWPKYGRRRGSEEADQYDNNDQRIHVDYPNHTLTHPTPWERPEAIEAIVYYGTFAECGGATAVVPRSGADDPAYTWPIVASPGIGELPWVNDRTRAEAALARHRPDWVELRERLYEREVYTGYRRGTVLLYRHDTWHRGTPLAPGTMRVAQNLTFRKAECEWIGTMHEGWAWKMYRADQYTERLVAAATPSQRTVLGFPAPDSSYWCPQTLSAVVARYGPFGFDPDPYQAAALNPKETQQ